MEDRLDLAEATVGILGMAFKAESDDIRSSLSYKLRRILRFKARRVLCTDPFVSVDPELVTLDHVLDKSDVLVIGTPHREYASIETDKLVIDVWNLLGKGVQV
jgi:UDP-N-acetyl-D-mannosaminuronic acid dehydrogenase